MSREILLKKTIEGLAKLPDHKLIEASEFVDFLLSRLEDKSMVNEISIMASESESFSFLNEDEVVYKKSDLKENYK
jgi:hypothetical protein